MNRALNLRTRLIATTLLVGIAGAALMAAVEVKNSNHELMRSKLTHAQTAMEGLALEDYEKIKSSGKELILISQQAEWTTLKSPRYHQLAGEFRGAVQKMVDMAEEKNLDGATLSFLQVTMSCVECHKLVRSSEKVAMLSPAFSDELIR